MELPKLRECCRSTEAQFHAVNCPIYSANAPVGYQLNDETIVTNGWLRKAAQRVIDWAYTKGWEPDPGRSFGDEMALLHSEVSEALEAYRRWGFADTTGDGPNSTYVDGGGTKHYPKPEGVGSEFADVLIRLLHSAAVRNIDLEFEFERKMQYNQERPWKHGGRAL